MLAGIYSLYFKFQSQHSHLVIQQLLGHLDANSRSPASVRAGIIEVLSEAAVIEASGSVGPSQESGLVCVCMTVILLVLHFL